MDLQNELENLSRKYEELQKLYSQYSNLLKQIEVEIIKVNGQIELVQKLMKGEEGEKVQDNGAED